MRLASLSLKNFRCYRAEQIDFSRYTAILGPNNSGKSTLLKAIDLFFRTTQKTSTVLASDFLDRDKELRIALTFADLPEKAINEFRHYFRHGKLEFFIKARVDERGGVTASVHGQRLGIKAFGPFFETSGANDKKARYAELRKQFPKLPDIPARSAIGVFEAAVIEFEGANTDKHEMIESEDLAFGVAGVASKLKKFVEWVYIPAVKDAADEDEEAKNTAFGTLINRIIRARVKVDEKVAAIQAAAHNQIKILVDDYKEEVTKLEIALDTEFRKITSTEAHVHLDWTDIGPSSVALTPPLIKSILSDETFKGDISSFGHGLQRNYLMTLVHLNAKMAIDDQPSIILACEEPELYQHPPQARYLHTALQKIAQSDQVLVTTHSPYFVSARTFEDIRVVRKSPSQLAKINAWTLDEHRQLIANVLDERPMGKLAAAAKLDVFLQPELNEAFFCGKLILVEGPEDRAILVAALNRRGLYDEFVRLGGHILPATGKGGLISMVAIARGFGTPYFVMFDADTGCDADAVDGNKKTNTTLIKLLGLKPEKFSWPDNNILDDRVIVWKEDIQSAIAAQYSKWFAEVKKVCSDWGWPYKKLAKNPAALTCALEEIYGTGNRIECLHHAVDKLMVFARTS